jgi:STAS domain
MQYLPKATLGAVIVAAAIGLVDRGAWQGLARISRVEVAIAAVTMAEVIAVGVLEALLVAVALSIVDVARRSATPHDAVLGWVERLGRYADVRLHPRANITPGVLIYRLDDRLFFANASYVTGRIHEALDGARRRCAGSCSTPRPSPTSTPPAWTPSGHWSSPCVRNRSPSCSPASSTRCARPSMRPASWTWSARRASTPPCGPPSRPPLPERNRNGRATPHRVGPVAGRRPAVVAGQRRPAARLQSPRSAVVDARMRNPSRSP